MKQITIPLPQSPPVDFPITLQSITLSFIQDRVSQELSIELTDEGAGFFAHIKTDDWSLDPNEDWITKLITQVCTDLDNQGKEEDE